jgi:hypothetical protein
MPIRMTRELISKATGRTVCILEKFLVVIVTPAGFEPALPP